MSITNKVIYQIYPKSFKDTNGDGIGDLQGVIQNLPYVKKLGAEMIWLNPIFPSPQKDNGYDVADYTSIEPSFGTMADFEELVEEAKKYEIELMLDMVFNHVSTEHSWFKKALAGDKYYQDFFILRDTPTNLVSKFGGSAWAPFGDTGKYYLHFFDLTQADLNWRNPNVREELFKVIQFWCDKGVTGFRFDMVNLIGKPEQLNDYQGQDEFTDTPLGHEYLKMMNQATFGQDSDIITVGEMSNTTIENCILYTRPDRQELDMTFNFHHLKVDWKNKQKWTKAAFDFTELKQLFHNWGEKMSAGNGWNALFWNNHDQPRALNRFGEITQFHYESATMLATSIHLSRGTPFIYMGEEIGMVDPTYESITDYVDVECLNAYEMLLEQGQSADEALEIIRGKARDNGRIPMQWDNTPHAGFTEGTPWLKVADSFQHINVKQELSEGKIFRFYQQLIRLRKELEIIQTGDYKAYARNHSQVYGFIRTLGNEQLLVLNNFYGESTEVQIPEKFVDAKILLSNYESTKLEKHVTLQPYQSIALLLGQ